MAFKTIDRSWVYNLLCSNKGDQSWVFIGRTDAKAGTPILWPPDANSWLIGKDPDAGKDLRWKEKRATEDEMVGWHHQFNGHKFEETPGDGGGTGKTDVLQSIGSKKVGHDWVTKNTAQKNKHVIYWYGCKYQKNSQKELKLVAFGEKIKGTEAAPCSNNQSYGTIYGTIWLFKLCVYITLAKTKLKRLIYTFFLLSSHLIR